MRALRSAHAWTVAAADLAHHAAHLASHAHGIGARVASGSHPVADKAFDVSIEHKPDWDDVPNAVWLER